MSEQIGRYLPLSLPRRAMCELMHCSRSVPLIPVRRRMKLAALDVVRQTALPRIGWCSLFVKAHALVAARRPELRRAYFSFPWPRLYEHPDSVASVAIERSFNDENGVFFAHVRSPDRQTLADIETHLRRCKEQPVEMIGSQRRYLRICALPWPLRRLVWWLGLNFSGPSRAKHMGTFGVSAVSGLGAELIALQSPMTSTLTYGPLDTDGTMNVTLLFDHRVLDGGDAARILAELEQALLSEILVELRYLRTPAAA